MAKLLSEKGGVYQVEVEVLTTELIETTLEECLAKDTKLKAKKQSYEDSIAQIEKDIEDNNKIIKAING